MKYLLIAIFWAFAAVGSIYSQTEETHPQFYSEKSRQIYSITHKNRPLEQFEVVYCLSGPNHDLLNPAYIDLETNTVYLWTDVMLKPEQIPSYFTHFPNGGSGLILPLDPSKSDLEFKNINPPIYYMPLPNGKYSAGYFDHGHGLYYRWSNLEYDKNKLPADALEKKRILPAGIVHISAISPPSNVEGQSSDDAGQVPSNDQPFSAPDQAVHPNALESIPPQTLKRMEEVPQHSEVKIPLFLYAVIVLSIGIIVVLWYRSQVKH